MGALHQILYQLLELRPRHDLIHGIGDIVFHREHRELYRVALLGAQRDFAAQRLIAHPRHGIQILRQIDSMLFPELFCQILDQTLVKILPAQLIVSAAGFYLKHALEHFQDRHVKGAAAQVIDQHMAFLLHVLQSIAERRCRGLVDDSVYQESRCPSGLHGLLALQLVKICRYGDDCAGDVRIEVFSRVISDIG